MPIDKNIEGQLRTMNIVYTAMAFTQLAFGGVVYFLVSSGSFGPPDYSMAVVFQTVALFFVPTFMAAGYFLFGALAAKVDATLPLAEKIKKYFTMILIRAALLEAPFLFLCVIALVTRVLLFLYVAPVLLLVFVLLRPTPETMAVDLKLTASEKSKLGIA